MRVTAPWQPWATSGSGGEVGGAGGDDVALRLNRCLSRARLLGNTSKCGHAVSVEPVPYPVYEAAVAVAGEALHWKQSLERIVRASGVAQKTYDRYQHLSKYQILRNIWGDLDAVGNKGRIVQHRIVKALANLDAPDPKAPDRAAGARALAELRRLATEAQMLVSPEEAERQARRAAAADAANEISIRRERLEALRQEFLALHALGDKQRRGYAFEKLLSGMFRLSELEYRGAYKTATDQIDGAVTLDSFTYLLEARWRKERAADAELGALTHKVERRLDATRGLFVSTAGYRDEAVNLYRLAKENRLVLVDGQDLAYILEGRISLVEGLREKVRAATIEGEPLLRLATL